MRVTDTYGYVSDTKQSIHLQYQFEKHGRTAAVLCQVPLGNKWGYTGSEINEHRQIESQPFSANIHFITFNLVCS